jgi:hypothetical protein
VARFSLSKVAQPDYFDVSSLIWSMNFIDPVLPDVCISSESHVKSETEYLPLDAPMPLPLHPHFEPNLHTHTYQPHFGSDSGSLLISDSGLRVGCTTVCVGSCIEVRDFSTQHVLIVSCVSIGSPLVISGFELYQTEVPLVMSCSPFPVTVNVTAIGKSFQVFPAWALSHRSFWPDFVVFIQVQPECSSPISLCLQGVNAVPSMFLSCDEQYSLNLFLSELIRSLNSFLHTRVKGDKVLFIWRPVQESLAFFLGCTSQKKSSVILSEKFHPLDRLLGPDYFFFGEEEGQYCGHSWGFYGEPACNHFITRIGFFFSTNGEMKCKAHQVLQNPKSKIFQTAKFIEQ